MVPAPRSSVWVGDGIRGFTLAERIEVLADGKLLVLVNGHTAGVAVPAQSGVPLGGHEFERAQSLPGFRSLEF